jgi:4-hydroxyacetophenone monooxygenase
MIQIDTPARHELLTASDELIEDAVEHADPMTLRGLVFQLTGDPDLKRLEIAKRYRGFYPIYAPADEQGAALVREKAAAFLKGYRDAGAGPGVPLISVPKVPVLCW